MDELNCYNIIKDFLIEHGTQVKQVKDKSFTCFQYQDEFTDVTFCQYMNGQGSYICSESFFFIYYQGKNTIVKKKGEFLELEKLAQRFIPIGRIKRLIAL